MNNKQYIYVSVSYLDDPNDKNYFYRTDVESIKVGDKVLVDRNGYETIGLVNDVTKYDIENIPYPIEKTKEIIKVIDNIYDFDKEKMLEDYHDLLLNNMFGRISIKRLMRLNSPKNWEEKNTLFYYPKFNTFFYKSKDDKYWLAEYKSNIITFQMFRLIEKESLEVPQKSYDTESNAYINAITFCQKHMLPFHDDTDILDFQKEKAKIYKDNTSFYEEPKDFNSLDEIKNYLQNEYIKAEWKLPNPSYYIDKGNIIHYIGWLEYDNRVFKIIDFLKKNNYIDEKYYHNLEFANENWHNYDIEKLDFARVSFMLFRIFNTERINEGTIDDMITSGIMLKLIERAEQLKNTF